MAEKLLPREEKIEQLILFHLDHEEYGIKITDVREIIKAGLITPVPDSPIFISGVINVRGLVIAVLDLKLRFCLKSEKEDTESKHVIITQQGNNLIGLMVDEVTEVLRLPQKLIKETPEIISNIREKYVSGVLTLGNRLVIMLDLNKILSEKELYELVQVAKKHEQIEPEGELEETQKPQGKKLKQLKKNKPVSNGNLRKARS